MHQTLQLTRALIANKEMYTPELRCCQWLAAGATAEHHGHSDCLSVMPAAPSAVH